MIRQLGEEKNIVASRISLDSGLFSNILRKRKGIIKSRALFNRVLLSTGSIPRADPGFFKGGGPKKVDLGFLCAV